MSRCSIPLALFKLRSFHVAMLHSTRFVFTLSRVALLFASATPIAPLPLVSLVISEGAYEKCDKIAKPAASGAEGVEPQAQRPTRRETPSGVANGAAGAMSKRRESG